MPRTVIAAVMAALATVCIVSSVWAEEAAPAVDPKPTDSAPLLASQAVTKVEQEWWDSYARGRALLLDEHYAQAAVVFEGLEVTADDGERRLLAAELAMIARALQGEHEAVRPDQIRTSDELALLYSTAFIYGFGSSAWVALQTRPGNFAGAVLPFAVLTTAAVGGVAAADGYRPFQLGIPQAISGGLYLGFLEGVWLVGAQQSGAKRRDAPSWDSARVSTILWTGATAGAVIGGIAASSEHPSPGKVSYVVSSSVWGGLLLGLSAAALQPNTDLRSETAFVAAGVGQNVGLGLGLLTVPKARVPIARVRVTDVSGLGGGLLAAGIYGAAAGDQGDPRWGFGVATLGAGAGLGLSWWLTRHWQEPKTRSRPIYDAQTTLYPIVVPTAGGVVFRLGAAL